MGDLRELWLQSNGISSLSNLEGLVNLQVVLPNRL